MCAVIACSLTAACHRGGAQGTATPPEREPRVSHASGGNDGARCQRAGGIRLHTHLHNTERESRLCLDGCERHASLWCHGWQLLQLLRVGWAASRCWLARGGGGDCCSGGCGWSVDRPGHAWTVFSRSWPRPLCLREEAHVDRWCIVHQLRCVLRSCTGCAGVCVCVCV